MKNLPEKANIFFNEDFKKVIHPEDWIFVDRLKENLQLRSFVYPNLDSSLRDEQNWGRFLTLVVDCAGLMQPEQTNKAREQKKQAEKLKQDIALYCEKLTESIDELNELGEQGLIETPYISDAIRVVIETGKDHYMFESYIKEKLNKSIVGFSGLKYFPSIQDVIRRIGISYKEQQIYFSDNYIILNTKPSPREFCVKLRLSIDEHIRCSALPKTFKMTQSQIADFCNALFQEENSITITTENVKQYLSSFRKSQPQDLIS